MTYVLEFGFSLFHLRSCSLEEEELQQTSESLPADFPEEVYLSIDVSVLDPSIMPTTRTPQPDGLSWKELLQWLENIVQTKTIIGFDLVELPPIKELHAPDFLCAKRVYSLLGLISRK